MSWGAVIAAVAAVATTAYSANEQKKGAAKARSSQEEIAKKQLQAEQDASMRSQQKNPNVQGLLGDNAAAARQGVSGTLLSGAQGVGMDQLKLGKNQLLGN